MNSYEGLAHVVELLHGGGDDSAAVLTPAHVGFHLVDVELAVLQSVDILLLDTLIVAICEYHHHNVVHDTQMLQRT